MDKEDLDKILMPLDKLQESSEHFGLDKILTKEERLARMSEIRAYLYDQSPIIARMKAAVKELKELKKKNEGE